MAAAKEKNVVPVESVKSTGVAMINDDLLAQYSGAGLEGTTAEDFAIPFLSMLQKGSPQVDPDESAYVEGARAGMLIDTVTGDIIASTADNPVIVIPCAFERKFIEWKPREQGGGINGIYDIEEGKRLLETCTRVEGKAVDILPNGNNLVDTRQHYVIYISPVTGEIKRAVISMKSTQLKYSRKWMNVIDGVKVRSANGAMVGAPSFACQYSLTSMREENDSGSWYSYIIKSMGRITDIGLLNEAIAFHNAIQAGSVKVQDPEAAEGLARASDGVRDEDITF